MQFPCFVICSTIFCNLLYVVDAVRLAVEVQQWEYYCHVSCVHMGAGLE